MTLNEMINIHNLMGDANGVLNISSIVWDNGEVKCGILLSYDEFIKHFTEYKEIPMVNSNNDILQAEYKGVVFQCVRIF